MWIEQPGWWALGISVLSLSLSGIAYRLGSSNRRIAVEQRLTGYIGEINETLSRGSVRSPYAVLLGVPEADLPSFAPKANVVLAHVNVLYTVFENQHVLGSRTLSHYENWARTIIDPWIRSDPVLRKVVNLTIQTNDRVDPRFNAWLTDLLPALAAEEPPQHL